MTLELVLRVKALREAAELLAQLPVHMQQAAMANALEWFRRQHHAARWSPLVSEAKAQQVILQHLIPGMVPQTQLKILRDVSPITPMIRLNDHGPNVPLWYMDDRGIRRQLQPDWPITLMHGNDAFDCMYEADRSTTSLISASGKRDMLLKLSGYWLHWQQTGHPFRMLMTCRSRERLEHMRALAREVVGKQAGSGLFWFALEHSVDPCQPEMFWHPLWQTPKNHEYHPLLGS